VWLIEQGYEVYAFLADVGQEEVWDTQDQKRTINHVFRRISRLPVRKPCTLVRKNSSSRLAGHPNMSVADTKGCAGRISSASLSPNSFIRLFKLMPSTRLACAFLNVDDVIRSTILDQNVYLLGTSLARPVIARGMIAIADREGCE
jgi:hypothetical protein